MGGASVEAAYRGETGKMCAIRRISDMPYRTETEMVDVQKVANLEKREIPKAIPHNSKCRYGERGAADAKPKAQIILDAAKVSAASGGNSEPKQGQRSQSARGFCPRSTMRVPQPDIIEHFGNADAVPQPPERCLSRQTGIVRCCLSNAWPTAGRWRPRPYPATRQSQPAAPAGPAGQAGRQLFQRTQDRPQALLTGQLGVFLPGTVSSLLGLLRGGMALLAAARQPDTVVLNATDMGHGAAVILKGLVMLHFSYRWHTT